ncbi:hypothetical protein BDV29DRAFT_166024 [Aspergillus leporis]|uniref:Uncharacterized protein n=1 Tax=Aspergillus leporis TaxID=41062 RepID=A0A5N5XD34_9EURO|nr:hypothetical protein BDV29DRAFT_166024 [Aspergillus leporis]
MAYGARRTPMEIYHDGDQVYRLLVGVALATITHPLFPYVANQAGTFLCRWYKPRHNGHRLGSYYHLLFRGPLL